ncbi:MAG: hypothetical protein AAGL90_01025 [Pseudomonadota bacterium]
MSPSVLKWGPAAFCFAVTLTYSLLFHFRAPFYDHWELIPSYAKYQDGTLRLSELFELHNAHWHASGHIAQLALSNFTSMQHWPLALVSVVSAGLGFLALARILDRSIKAFDVSSATFWVFGCSALFLFSLDQASNWLWGWQISVFISAAGVLWTIERLTSGAPTITNTAIAVFATAAAIYGFATSWMLIPIGFVLLIFSGAFQSWRGWVSLALWSVLTVLLLWHFSLALTETRIQHVEEHMPSSMDLASVFGLIHYTSNFLASPVARFVRDAASIATLFGFALLAWSIWTLWRIEGHRAWRAMAPFLAMAVYGIGAGFLTALGRYEVFDTVQAFSSRYITFASFFWIAVFSLSVFAIFKARPAKNRAWVGLAGLLFVLKLGNIPGIAVKSVVRSYEVRAAAEVLAETYPNTPPEQYTALHAPQQRIEPRLDVLMTHRASLFAGSETRLAEPEAQE